MNLWDELKYFVSAVCHVFDFYFLFFTFKNDYFTKKKKDMGEAFISGIQNEIHKMGLTQGFYSP